MKPIAMIKRTRSRLNNGRGRLGYNKPTLADGQEVRPRFNNVQQNYEKYLTLARDALTSGDRITAEGFYQHAEHYLRLMNEYKLYLQEKSDQELTPVENPDITSQISETMNKEDEETNLEKVSMTSEDKKTKQLVA